jgi:tRNA pseudouridine65 synthase
MRILYRDAHLVAVFKPAGMLVHRSAIDSGAADFALQRTRDLLGRRVFPVHRLDRPTAGVLLFALTREAAQAMTGRFAAGEVEKRYVAVVRGHTAEDGVIDHPLAEAHDPATDARARSGKPPQDATTRYRRLATAELPVAVGRYPTARYSLLVVEPLTGRRHQIRRHLKHVFHPVIGDTTHGDGRHNALFRERFGCRRLLLAATGLAFVHPIELRDVTIEAGLDDEMARVVAALGWGCFVAGPGIGHHP